MGFYDNHVLPRMMNVMMGMPYMAPERTKALAGVTGDVLEVGFGAGHNLPCYPDGVRRVVAVDPSTQSAKLARKRIEAARFPVEYVPLEGERIAAPDAAFDSVVSTFTMCTIPDLSIALAQMRRVLKPGGKLFFVEHGRSPELGVQRWQDRLNPAQRFMFGGCNMNRDIEKIVRDAGFRFDELEKYYLEGQPKIFAYLTRGVARAA
ncbi:MAG TPA: class I SAM-dependent methyltransferase [Polyangiales bacterium]|jgi:ubiquinone/menaquinone biosynthesis C-methylase UbiE|nr:class I SAM-dependent methyltransferase [Polyangiales bacterium]